MGIPYHFSLRLYLRHRRGNLLCFLLWESAGIRDSVAFSTHAFIYSPFGEGGEVADLIQENLKYAFSLIAPMGAITGLTLPLPVSGHRPWGAEVSDRDSRRCPCLL